MATQTGAARHIHALIDVVIVLAAGWLILAGLAKATDESFGRILASHAQFSSGAIRPLTLAVPAGEIGIGVAGLLLAGACGSRRLGAALLVFPFAVFAAYATLMVVNPPSNPVPCGCGFSRAPVTAWDAIVWRNAIVAGVLLACALMRGRTTRPA